MIALRRNSYGGNREELNGVVPRADGSPFLQLTSCPHTLASRPASLNTTDNIGLAPSKGFQRTDVNYNFRRCSAKARLMLCMTQNQGWLISLSSGCGDGTFFSARGI